MRRVFGFLTQETRLALRADVGILDYVSNPGPTPALQSLFVKHCGQSRGLFFGAVLNFVYYDIWWQYSPSPQQVTCSGRRMDIYYHHCNAVIRRNAIVFCRSHQKIINVAMKGNTNFNLPFLGNFDVRIGWVSSNNTNHLLSYTYHLPCIIILGYRHCDVFGLGN